MASFPELLDEDVQEINTALRDFLDKAEATVALVTAEGGFIVFQQGELERFDATTLGALSANAFNAAQAIASVISEPGFAHIYQQGERFSLLVSGIDKHNSLVVIFPAQVSVGAVKYYAAPAVDRIGRQLHSAHERPGSRCLDLAMLNMMDASEVFKKRPADPGFPQIPGPRPPTHGPFDQPGD